MSWTVLFTRQEAQPPPHEALVGKLRRACSRRINIQHRLVYQVLGEGRILKVLRYWSHYASRSGKCLPDSQLIVD